MPTIMLNFIMQRIRAYRLHRRTLEILRHLEDWELTDIGVHRGDIGRTI
ncbi:DUF1127 domain-containing protein [Consotaella salsifontis]|nr:DUF1127 domain-containing protein [Consotaella salsifontis]